MFTLDQLTDRDTVSLMKFATLTFNRRDYHDWKAFGEPVAPNTLNTRSERSCGARTDFSLLLPRALLSFMLLSRSAQIGTLVAHVISHSRSQHACYRCWHIPHTPHTTQITALVLTMLKFNRIHVEFALQNCPLASRQGSKSISDQ